jgi:hypothetical protein
LPAGRRRRGAGADGRYLLPNWRRSS